MNGFATSFMTSVKQNRGFYGALVLFLVIYGIYNILHPRGFSSAILIQNANESVAIVFVAMAQTLPVLLGGLDLSVGAVMTLTNCIASEIVTGSPGQIMLGMVVTLLAGAGFGFMNGLIVVYGRLQPIIATLATGAVAMGLALFIRPKPGGNVDDDVSWALTNALWDFVDTYGFFDPDAAWFQPIAWIPVPLLIIVVIAFGVWLPFRRTVTGRTIYAIGSAEGAAFHVRPAHRPGEDRRLHPRRLLRRLRRALPRHPDLVGQCRYRPGRRLYAELDRRGGARRHLAPGRRRRRHRLADRRADPPDHLLLLPHPLHRPAAAAADRGRGPAGRGQPRGLPDLEGEEPAGALPMTRGTGEKTAMTALLSRIKPEDKPIWISTAFILVILAIGTGYTLTTQGTAPLLSPNYLLQQLQTGAFLGIVAAGMMVVILLGNIDLSVPWTLTAAAMMAATVGGAMALPTAIAIGVTVGLINGFGVAYLRIPSMIFTLGVDSVLRGLMVAHTGGFAPQDKATPLMRFLAADQILGVPTAIYVWAAVSLVIAVMLRKTAFGRSVYATGNREAAAYLSGIRTRLVIIGTFVTSGVCAAIAGVLLTGYSNKAYQGMGNEFLLPAIAAVVIGGTRILGGQGRYVGTLIGVILIVLLKSVLSIMQMPEAGRQVIYGVVIIMMLLFYGRGQKVTQ